jgi:hypothetical protein
MCNDNKGYTTIAAETTGLRAGAIQHKVGVAA